MLIATLGEGRGTWSSVAKLINSNEWGEIVLITNSFGKKRFMERYRVNAVIIEINDESNVLELAETIANSLRSITNKELEVALNIESGSGKLHTAIIAALIGLGISFRFVGIENDKVVEISTSPYSLYTNENPLNEQ